MEAKEHELIAAREELAHHTNEAYHHYLEAAKDHVKHREIDRAEMCYFKAMFLKHEEPLRGLRKKDLTSAIAAALGEDSI